jgi:patatin-like phospholipase/acyl hydrolase
MIKKFAVSLILSSYLFSSQTFATNPFEQEDNKGTAQTAAIYEGKAEVIDANIVIESDVLEQEAESLVTTLASLDVNTIDKEYDRGKNLYYREFENPGAKSSNPEIIDTNFDIHVPSSSIETFNSQISEEKVTEFLKKKGLTLSPEKPLFEKGGSEEEEAPQYLGLALDGGGIRGAMTAHWLAYAEQKLIEKYGDQTRLWEVFDCIGGTSIGGILALGTADGMKATDLLALFEQHADQIFSPEKLSFIQLINFWGAVSHLYSSEPLTKLLQEKFSVRSLADLKTDILVTACTAAGDPKIFKKDGKRSQDTQIWQAARCSSAAPTYFSAYDLHSKSYVDGGIWCNNPSVLVAAHLINRNVDADWREDIHILSLGTGENSRNPIPGHAGKVAAGKIIDALMTSHSQGNHSSMQQLFGRKYHRVNAYLNKSIELDDIKAVPDLIAEAKKYEHKIDAFLKKYDQVIAKKIQQKRQDS